MRVRNLFQMMENSWITINTKYEGFTKIDCCRNLLSPD